MPALVSKPFIRFGLLSLGLFVGSACQKSTGKSPADTPLPESPPTLTELAGEPTPPLENNEEGEEPASPAEPESEVIAPAGFTLAEIQYWPHQKSEDGKTLSFNTPWDSEEGDGIVRGEGQGNATVQTCLSQSRAAYELFAQDQETAALVGRLISLGVTSKLIFQMNVIGSDEMFDELRRLDRDAYFSQRNEDGKRPSLAMSQFTQGAFVWEAVATPKRCLLPDPIEAKRYLTYVESRMKAEGVVRP